MRHPPRGDQAALAGPDLAGAEGRRRFTQQGLPEVNQPACTSRSWDWPQGARLGPIDRICRVGLAVPK